MSIIIVYILFLLILYLILNLVIPSVFNSIALFFSNFQSYYNRAQQLIDYINDLDFINVDISMDNILNWVRDISLDNLSSSLNALFGVSSAIFKSFLAFISSIYILFEKDKFTAFLSRLFTVFSSTEVYNAIYKYANRLNKNFKRYIYAQTIDGCILGSIATIELYILRSPFALTLGIMLGIINYIPYFGSIIGTTITIVIVAFTQGIPSALVTAAILLITQQIDGNIIQPKLLGGSFSLSPLLVIICITIGGAFAGVLGMIAAIPIIAVLKDMFDEIITYFEQKKMSRAKEEE